MDLVAATGLEILLKLDSNRNFSARVTLKLDRWPGKIIGISSMLHQALCIIPNPSVNSNWSYSPETPNSGQYQRFIVPCDLEIRWMTFQNSRTLLSCYVSFVHHFKAIGKFNFPLQSGNAPFGSKSEICCLVWPWNLTVDLEKQFGTSSMFLQTLCMIP